MIKRLIAVIAGFILIVFLLGFVKVAQIKGMPQQGRPITAVSAVEAKTDSWHPTLSAIGTVVPVQGVALAMELEGTITKINFENGQAVHAGDVLIELDTSVEEAQLKAAEAQLEWTTLQANRSKELLAKNTVSQAELDQNNAQRDQAEANVTGLKSTIAKKVLKAPFDGRVGIREVNLGQYVSRGQAIVSLQKLDQLYVNFSLAERELSKLTVGENVNISVDAFPGREFAGKLNAINTEVDASTRNISVQGVFDNPQESLRSGMFARVEVELPQAQPLVVVPETSISYAAYGNSVFIVEKMKDKEGHEYLGVRQQFVKLGDKRGDLVSVLDGVKAGEQVVSAGVFKLRNALPVEINNTVQPSANENPKPANT